MTLQELKELLGLSGPECGGAPVAGVTEDSRRVQAGWVFFAAPGEHVDGHDFAGAAVQAGAIAIVGGRQGVEALYGAPYLYSPQPRRALGIAAHALAGDPSRRMSVIGVTGTNGKSSSVLALHHVFQACGYKSASFGTLGYDIAGTLLPAPHTTPFAEDLADLFKRAADAGVAYAAMEASSHALEQERVAGIEFDAASFTNLTQDHLDYHKDMDAYRNAKLRLFERIEGPGRFTVVNRDDPSAEAFIRASHVPCHTYGAKADCRAVGVSVSVGRTRFTVHTPWGSAPIEMRLLGRHNVSNILGVIAVACGFGLPLEGVAAAIGGMPCVPGRFEHVDAGQNFQVIVDYAHTEDGLRNVLRAAREICKGRIITVFGCGGDRDKTKRPKMAMAVAELSDFSILTSDNPRTEEPARILLDIEVGMQRAGKRKTDDYLMLLDRAEAIEAAIGMAQPGGLILIAGKGHEDYQILGTQRIHFDDREAARAALERRGVRRD